MVAEIKRGWNRRLEWVGMRLSDGCRQGVVKLFTQESTKDISYIISTRCGSNPASYLEILPGVRV